jgi:hypothetical protein
MLSKESFNCARNGSKHHQSCLVYCHLSLPVLLPSWTSPVPNRSFHEMQSSLVSPPQHRLTGLSTMRTSSRYHGPAKMIKVSRTSSSQVLTTWTVRPSPTFHCFQFTTNTWVVASSHSPPFCETRSCEPSYLFRFNERQLLHWSRLLRFARTGSTLSLQSQPVPVFVAFRRLTWLRPTRCPFA